MLKWFLFVLGMVFVLLAGYTGEPTGLNKQSWAVAFIMCAMATWGATIFVALEEGLE